MLQHHWRGSVSRKPPQVFMFPYIHFAYITSSSDTIAVELLKRDDQHQ
jgi:hypothetical protein